MNTSETASLRASIVVISKDERELDTTLTALESHRTRHQMQTLVVDASAGRLSEIARAHPGVEWIDYAPPPGHHKKITIPEQRNRGIEATQGDVVVFIDAGCLPAEGWLDRLLEPIATGAEQVVVGGRHNLADVRYNVANAADHYVEDSPTLNIAFARSVFERAGRFDEGFYYGSDIDLCWRLGDAGVRLLMVPSAEVSVHWGNTRRQVRRAWRYGIARARLYRKHPGRLKGMPGRDPILVIYPAFLLGSAVMMVAPWYPVVLLYPLLLLVPGWRARGSKPLMTVVDHVVFGAGALAHVVAGAR